MVSLCVLAGAVRPGGGVRGGLEKCPTHWQGCRDGGWLFLRKRLVGRLSWTQGNVFQSEGGRGKHHGRCFFNLGNSRGIFSFSQRGEGCRNGGIQVSRRAGLSNPLALPLPSTRRRPWRRSDPVPACSLLLAGPLPTPWPSAPGGRPTSACAVTPPAAGTAPPPLPRWWPAAPRLPVVKLESLKRWNEERGLWCEKGVQVLLTTVGAFAAFGLMTIAISTDYWLYTRAFICNTTNLTAGAGGDDGPPQRGGGGAAEKKDPGGLTHSGLWRICCLEGRAPRPAPRIFPRGLPRPPTLLTLLWVLTLS